MKIFREISRILLGITFIFSGLVKGIDPLGSTYKFSDYFTAFGADWAIYFALALSFLLSMAEFGIGVALFVNYRLKISSWLVLLFMGFFLPLTLWVAIANPVSDCGCFGDALVISNWETFYKNIVLSIFALIVFVKRSDFKNKFNIHLQNGLFVFILLVFGFLQIHAYNHLPLLDFRPYKVGVNIIEGMQMPDDAPTDEYKTEFIYKNKITGKEKEFNETNYPWQDTINWEYADSKSVLVKEGYHPPIHNFTIENSYGEEVKDFYLFDPNYTFILVSYNINKSDKKQQEKINTFSQMAMDEGLNFICLTSSTQTEIDKFIVEYQPPYEFFFCDEITLKTIVRSNPGLVLTQEGNILEKWHWKDIPEFENLNL